MRIAYSAHALDTMADRALDQGWIERTVTTPESTEPDPKHPERIRAYRSVPERGGRMLRMVSVPIEGGAHIVTALLDRRRRRSL